MTYQLHNRCCIEVMQEMSENSADAIATDPPYGLSHDYESLRQTGPPQASLDFGL